MTTRPGEIQRIRELANGDEYRAEVLTALAVLQERSEHQSEWMRQHDRRDDERFGALEQKVTGVSSSANDLQINSRYSLKEVAVGFLVLCGALGGLIGFIYWAIGNAGKGAP